MIENKPSTKPTLMASEVAALLGCTPQWVGRLVRSGEIKSFRLRERGWLRVSRKSLEEYAAARNIDLDWEMLDRRQHNHNEVNQ